MTDSISSQAAKLPRLTEWIASTGNDGDEHDVCMFEYTLGVSFVPQSAQSISDWTRIDSPSCRSRCVD